MFHNHKLCYMNSRMVQIFFGFWWWMGGSDRCYKQRNTKNKEKLKEFIYPEIYLLSLSTSF